LGVKGSTRITEKGQLQEIPRLPLSSAIHSAMASSTGAPSGGDIVAKTSRRYLDIQPIRLYELPLHGDTSNDNTNQGPTLATFLNSVLTEAYQINFDGDNWISHGTFPSAPPGEVRMPPLPGTASAAEKSVPFQVDKKANGRTSSAWLGRTSYHSAQDIAYSELDTLLSQDHCHKEAEYTPSVFEANQLLKWSEEELQRAVADLKPEWKVKRVQMSSKSKLFLLLDYVIRHRNRLAYSLFHQRMIS
jgi:hypothetical protein